MSWAPRCCSPHPPTPPAPRRGGATRSRSTRWRPLALLVGGPLLLFLLISLAVYLPALARGEKVTPGEPESEWFGGPRQGVQAADRVDAEALEGKGTGGASGRW